MLSKKIRKWYNSLKPETQLNLESTLIAIGVIALLIAVMLIAHAVGPQKIDPSAIAGGL